MSVDGLHVITSDPQTHTDTDSSTPHSTDRVSPERSKIVGGASPTPDLSSKNVFAFGLTDNYSGAFSSGTRLSNAGTSPSGPSPPKANDDDAKKKRFFEEIAETPLASPTSTYPPDSTTSSRSESFPTGNSTFGRQPSQQDPAQNHGQIHVQQNGQQTQNQTQSQQQHITPQQIMIQPNQRIIVQTDVYGNQVGIIQNQPTSHASAANGQVIGLQGGQTTSHFNQGPGSAQTTIGYDTQGLQPQQQPSFSTTAAPSVSSQQQQLFQLNGQPQTTSQFNPTSANNSSQNQNGQPQEYYTVVNQPHPGAPQQGTHHRIVGVDQNGHTLVASMEKWSLGASDASQANAAQPQADFYYNQSYNNQISQTQAPSQARAPQQQPQAQYVQIIPANSLPNGLTVAAPFPYSQQPAPPPQLIHSYQPHHGAHDAQAEQNNVQHGNKSQDHPGSCKFFSLGHCVRGNRCNYSHSSPNSPHVGGNNRRLGNKNNRNSRTPHMNYSRNGGHSNKNNNKNYYNGSNSANTNGFGGSARLHTRGLNSNMRKRYDSGSSSLINGSPDISPDPSPQMSNRSLGPIAYSNNSKDGGRYSGSSSSSHSSSNYDPFGDEDGDHPSVASTSIADLKGNIYSSAKDQYGCRLLQRMLDEQSEPDTIKLIFDEVYDHMNELMTDPFGNYLCQKLIEQCDDHQRQLIIEKVANDLVAISLNMHGTRAVQKLVETVTTPEEIKLVVSILQSNVITLIKDLNGNHVIQRCLHYLCASDNQFVYDAVGRHCVSVATHKHGCCVMQRCIDYATTVQKRQLVQEITANSLELVQDAFGNYVVQYILDLGEARITRGVVEALLDNVPNLAVQKFSSNVVEKLLELATPQWRIKLVDALIDLERLPRLLQDPYANYVIQKALSVSKKARFDHLITVIRPHLMALRNTPSGQRIQSKIIKKFPEFNIGPSYDSPKPNNRMGVGRGVPMMHSGSHQDALYHHHQHQHQHPQHQQLHQHQHQRQHHRHQLQHQHPQHQHHQHLQIQHTHQHAPQLTHAPHHGQHQHPQHLSAAPSIHQGQPPHLSHHAHVSAHPPPPQQQRQHYQPAPQNPVGGGLVVHTTTNYFGDHHISPQTSPARLAGQNMLRTP